MENNPSLFSLSVDAATGDHMVEAAKWARFLAIVGFLFLGLLVVIGVFASTALMEAQDELSRIEGGTGMRGIGVVSSISYVLAALIWFFPLLFLYRFGSGLQQALQENNQTKMTRSFQNLKICFRYLGIATIIGLVLFVLGVLVGIAGFALSS